MNGLEILVHGLFDYAGMFPPAGLSLEETLKTAAGFADKLKNPALVKADSVLTYDDFAGMDAGLLKTSGFTNDRAVRLSVLGPDLSEQKNPYAAHIERIEVFNKDGAGLDPARRVVAFEVKLPAGMKVSAAAVNLDRLRRGLALGDVQVYVEPQWTPQDWAKRSAELFTMFDALHGDAGRAKVGLKVRGSGPTAIDIESLVRLIPLVVARALPLKATAGLHHPIPEPGRYDNTLGFVNLIVALRLAGGLGVYDFGAEDIRGCLRSQKAADFSFDDKVSWGKSSIGMQELYNQKQRVPFSIGSCSLDEPDEDLFRLFSPAGHLAS